MRTMIDRGGWVMGEVRSLSEVLAETEASLATPEEVARWEREQIEQHRSDSLRMSGVLDVLALSGADAVIRDVCTVTPAMRLVREWLATKRPVLALFGDKGLGKTVAAAWALARVPGRYAEAAALCTARTADYGAPSDWYEKSVRAGLLVVDELGLEPDATVAAAALHDVINRRQRLPRRTLLLGNVSKRDFLARYDVRTIDRLREIAVVRKIDGTSMRSGTL